MQQIILTVPCLKAVVFNPMLTLLTILSLLGSLTATTFPTDVFKPPITGLCYVTDDHRVFVLDPDDCVIRVFDRDGRNVLEIGGRGDGPGLFLSPNAIDIVGDMLYVYDGMKAKIEIFSLRGDWQASLKVPRPATSLAQFARKLTDGWIFQTSANALVWADDTFQNYRVIEGSFDLDDSQSWRLPPQERLFGGERLFFTVSASRATVYYFVPGGKSQLQVFDVNTHRLKAPLEFSTTLIPMEKDVAQARLKALYKSAATYKPDVEPEDQQFPTHYSRVSYMHMTPEGFIQIEPGGPLGHKAKPILLSIDGTDKKPMLENIRPGRFLKIINEWAYIAFLVDDEVTIQRLKYEDLGAYRTLLQR